MLLAIKHISRDYGVHTNCCRETHTETKFIVLSLQIDSAVSRNTLKERREQ